MKKSSWIILGVIILAIAGYFIIKPQLANKKLEYTYTLLKKGDIESTVSSTGTLEAINTVEVGTQISGTIVKIYADYNDEVKAGQLLAEMDLRLLETNLLNAQANLAVAQTRLNQAKEDFQRDKNLFGEKVISEQQYTNSKYANEQALSAMKAAEASVNSIKVNMGYARITSPINGTVTERSVEEGQTVAASFSTPRMFMIAEDLSQMQILADVDESDIGFIKDSMAVRFTVQTYPEREFRGIVSQIRLQPININNVVNYQVVIDVNNKKGELLPGMTSNIEFIVDTAKDILLINNSALRFRPNNQMLKEIKSKLIAKSMELLPDTLHSRFNEAINSDETYSPANFKRTLPSKYDGFFYTDANGELDFEFIEVGIKSGLESEVKRFLDDTPMHEGDKVINSIKSNQ